MELQFVGAAAAQAKDCPLHKHSVWEIVLDTVGNGTAYIGEGRYSFAPGTIFIIPPEVPHKKVADNVFFDYFLHVDHLTLGDDLDPSQPIILLDDAKRTFEHLVKSLHQLNYSELPNKQSMVSSLFHVIIQLLTDWYVGKMLSSPIEKIQSQMIASFVDPEISVNGILESSGYSIDYIRKRFAKETGYTPIEYLTHLRVDYAKQLLAQKYHTELSIKEISYMCGYYDSHYFSTVFKHETGLSPRKFMLQQLNTPLPATQEMTDVDEP